jgi:hypothetical protein
LGVWETPFPAGFWGYDTDAIAGQYKHAFSAGFLHGTDTALGRAMAMHDTVFTVDHLIRMLDTRLDAIRAEYQRTGDKATYDTQTELAYAEHANRMKGI